MTDLFKEAQETLGTVSESEPFTVDAEHRRTFEHGSYLTEMYGDDAGVGYPDDLIEGFHLLSLIDPVNHNKADQPRNYVGWNYGLNRVRFVRPAMINREYRCRNKVVEVTERGPNVLVRRDVEILDEDDQLIMVAEWLVLLVPIDS